MADQIDLKLPSLERLQSAEQMELLDVVDSLRACGLSEIVALPQLIVCGDQSSGKSSVLEALSGIPFPRQDNLCTRFATEVILRRGPRDAISVSIVPAKDRVAGRERLMEFRHTLKTKKDFKDLFDLARDAMGLSATGKSFARDTLRVEFCGPSQPQLTLVDLPGLIHSELDTQTSGDVKLVHNLVSEYLKNPRSIILAVVSAKQDIGTQVILNRARQFDPEGTRTLGIITKPDVLPRGSESEEAFVRLARNEEVKLSALGWHVVKNIDSATSSNQNDSRDESEKTFFQESSFNCLPAHTVGIHFLRARLSKVLFNQIRKELPRLVEDIQSQISSAKAANDRLGPSRAQLEEQRSFLLSLSQSFQAICRDAVRGDYENEFFRDDANPERRLCAIVMNMHFSFANNLRKDGASWLVDGENVDSIKYRTREQAIKEACDLLKKSRGRELPGLPNPLLVGELFRMYSEPWERFARLHIKNVWEAINRFFELLLRHLTDDDVSENMLRFWLYPIMEERLNRAYGKLDELLEVHKDYPMTTNSHFISSSKASREENLKVQFTDAMKQAGIEAGQNVSVEEITRLFATVSTQAHLDMDMVAAEEAFDNMNAYYEVAMNLFTDNVPTLAIQGSIIREVPKILCPTAVNSMDTDVVKRIAGETEEKILERRTILNRLGILESGLRICKQYAKRPQSFLSALTTEAKISELPITPQLALKEDGRKKDGQSSSIFTSVSAQQTASAFAVDTTVNTPTIRKAAMDNSTSNSPQSTVSSQNEESPNSATGTPSSFDGKKDLERGTVSLPEAKPGQPIGFGAFPTPGSRSSRFGAAAAPNVFRGDIPIVPPIVPPSGNNFGASLGFSAPPPNSSPFVTPSIFGGTRLSVEKGSKPTATGQSTFGTISNFLPKSDIFPTTRPPSTVGHCPVGFQLPEPGDNNMAGTNNFQHICCDSKYQSFSSEELRLEDYRIDSEYFLGVNRSTFKLI